MIILYTLDLLVLLIFSIGALTLIVALNFSQFWKAAVGVTLSACILISAAVLSSHISGYRQEAAEFSRLAQEMDVYLQKRIK